MTQFSDDLWLGNADSSILPNVSGQLQYGGRGFGPLGRVYLYDIAPLTLQTNNIATTQTPGAAGNLALTAGTGVTAVIDANGVTRYVLDVPRAIKISCAGADSGRTFTLTGHDFYGQLQTATQAGAGTGNTISTKTFADITSVSVDAATAGAITVGTADVFGLPAAISNVAYVLSHLWDSTLAANAGTFVAADATSPATASTGDVRGTYAQSGNASNGTRRLVLALGLTAIQVGPNATRLGLLGVTPV